MQHGLKARVLTWWDAVFSTPHDHVKVSESSWLQAHTIVGKQVDRDGSRLRSYKK